MDGPPANDAVSGNHRKNIENHSITRWFKQWFTADGHMLLLKIQKFHSQGSTMISFWQIVKIFLAMLEDMLKYAWYRAGYTEEHSPVFQTPAQFCNFA